MAFAVTARHAGQVNDSQTVTTDSVTPTASSLLLLFSAAQNSSHSTAKSWQTPTGGSLTYTSIATSGSFNWDGLADFAIEASSWRAAVGASPSAHTVTVDAFSGTAIANYNALTVDITGHNTTTPVTQSKTNGASVATGDSVSGTVTLDATPAVGSLVVVHFAAGNDVSGAFTAPTIGGQSMTQLHNQSATFCHGGVWYRVITGAESNSVITCSDMGQSVGNWTGIAVEIAAAGGTTFTQSLAGSATPTGSLAKQDQKPTSGATTPTGAIAKRAQKTTAGGTTPTGALAKAISNLLSGGTTPSGALAKLISKALSGSSTPSGALANAVVKILALAGSVTPTGSLAKQVDKQTTGSTTPTSTVAKAISKVTTGATTPAGVLLKLIGRVLAGSTTPSGALTNTVAGVTVTPAGRTYTVPEENRTLTVEAESRTLTVPAESRVYTA